MDAEIHDFADTSDLESLKASCCIYSGALQAIGGHISLSDSPFTPGAGVICYWPVPTADYSLHLDSWHIESGRVKATSTFPALPAACFRAE